MAFSRRQFLKRIAKVFAVIFQQPDDCDILFFNTY